MLGNIMNILNHVKLPDKSLVSIRNRLLSDLNGMWSSKEMPLLDSKHFLLGRNAYSQVADVAGGNFQFSQHSRLDQKWRFKRN